MIRPLTSMEDPPMSLLLSADPSDKMVQSYLDKGVCFVMEKHDQIVGAYILVPVEADASEIANIAVLEKYQRQGLGKALLLDAFSRAENLPVSRLLIGTADASIHQLTFYQAMGFHITGRISNFFVEHYEEPIYENGVQCRDMIRLAKEV
ncbi:acetyltransferase (GNAT) family protein [Sinobaca qinghaiensis]|uniref:Acetyltransferase (GNAT) family protein n=1 Tax=Sinobaca qinghaiensis TaxID=342944 RepID=A0A419V546_9BACL|nr:GNAT family N-acetyltransferase [Sinobaca qinghaiensis]RKD73614.1 acetyltransferase (GNAT) family protein [Sinobaca qinghaiensis]